MHSIRVKNKLIEIDSELMTMTVNSQTYAAAAAAESETCCL